MLFLARLISFVSNPIFILIGLPFYLVLSTTDNFDLAMKWTLFTWGFLFVFVVFVLYGVYKKFFTDVDVSKREQRPLLYTAGAILTLLYTILLYVLNGPPVLFICIAGILLGILTGSLVNLKVKASVHVASITALITGLIAVYQGYFVLLVLLIPAICWSRIRIKRHSFNEVVAGGILGSLLSLIMYFVAKIVLNI